MFHLLFKLLHHAARWFGQSRNQTLLNLANRLAPHHMPNRHVALMPAFLSRSMPSGPPRRTFHTRGAWCIQLAGPRTL